MRHAMRAEVATMSEHDPKTCPACKDLIDNPANQKGRWISREEAKEIIRILKRQLAGKSMI